MANSSDNHIINIGEAGSQNLSDFVRSEGPSTEMQVGVKIRELRNDRGFSLRVMAERSGLNINTLSMIEKGKTSPSVGTLQRIAKVLDVPIVSLFDSGQLSKPVLFTRHDQRPEAICCEAIVQNLAKGLKDSTIEPFVITMQENATSGGRTIVHSGYEFAYCLSGKILYIIEEDEFSMKAGDSIVFAAQLPHRWQNINNGESQFMLVLTPADPQKELSKSHFHTEEGK
jgi:transcriptional regulator with XRE-family HTH domain